MNWSTVWTVLYHELRMVFRDHRTIVLSVILPIGLMPILLMTAQAIHARRAGANSQPIYLYCLQGDPSPKLRQFLARRLNGREFKESLEDRAEQALLRGDIEQMKSTGKSLMPDGLHKEIDEQAMADLLAYLSAVR